MKALELLYFEIGQKGDNLFCGECEVGKVEGVVDYMAKSFSRAEFGSDSRV